MESSPEHSDAGVQSLPAPAPERHEFDAIVPRVRDRAMAWLRRYGHLDGRSPAERSHDLPAQTALDACAASAVGRGTVSTLSDTDVPEDDHRQPADKPSLAVEHAGNDLGRERLCRCGAHPPLSFERLRRLPAGKVAYRLRYVSRGRGKHRIMTGLEFMARLAALICAPLPLPVRREQGVPTHRRRPAHRRDPAQRMRTWLVYPGLR